MTECADLWKDVSKNLGKRRALSELLKLLESCGLSRHKSIFFEVLKNECYFLWFSKFTWILERTFPFSFNAFFEHLRCYCVCPSCVLQVLWGFYSDNWLLVGSTQIQPVKLVATAII